MKPSGRLRAEALLFTLLLLSACTLDSPAAPSARKVADASAKAGGTINIAVTEPDGIDPTDAHEPSNQLIASTMCDQLIMLDPVTSEPKPALAESWSLSGGGRRLILKLRKDLKFSDGTDLTADDVVFSLTRLADQRFASRSARVIEAIAGFGFIHGDVETDEDRFRDNLIGVRAIENRAVEITLEDRQSDFFLALTHPATSIVPRAAVEGDPRGFGAKPVCAGPYRIDKPWVAGQPVELVRNENYYAANSAFTRGGRGYADRIVFQTFPDRAQVHQAVVSGTSHLGAVPEERLKDASTPDVTLVEGPTPRLEFIGLPTGAPPFDDRAVRAAFSMALDRTKLADEIYLGGRAPATSFLPAPWSEDSCPSAPPAGDVDGARAAIAEAGIALAGQKVKIHFNDEFSNGRLVAAVAARWTEVFGVQVEAVPMSWEKFLSAGISPRGFDGAFRFGWYPPYPSVDRVLVPLFHEEGIGRDNLTRFSSRDFNEAIAVARRSVDPRDRAAAYARAARLVCEQMPAIPLFFEERSYLVRSGAVGSAAGALLSEYSAEPIMRELFAK